MAPPLPPTTLQLQNRHNEYSSHGIFFWFDGQTVVYAANLQEYLYYVPNLTANNWIFNGDAWVDRCGVAAALRKAITKSKQKEKKKNRIRWLVRFC